MGDDGVGGAAFGGVGRAFRPAPRLTDDSMVFFQTFELRAQFPCPVPVTVRRRDALNFKPGP